MIRTLLSFLGEDHEVIKKIKGIASGELLSPPDDFTMEDEKS
jgi:hypothetical protein